jgi:hypothetical protein
MQHRPHNPGFFLDNGAEFPPLLILNSRAAIPKLQLELRTQTKTNQGRVGLARIRVFSDQACFIGSKTFVDIKLIHFVSSTVQQKTPALN